MRTILFDLDGTLLPMNLDRFEKEYFKAVTSHFKNRFMPEKIIQSILTATNEMINNLEPDKNNKEVFMKKFCDITSTEEKEIYKLFEEFYESGYKSLSLIFTPSEHIKNSINVLKKKGYELVVATNPLFPIAAIFERIIWAGLNPYDFKFITCFEEMHYCKPQIQFYEELLKRIGRKAEECLMVGNDVTEDLIAGQIGIKTYLIEDHILNRRNSEIKCDYRGSYEDFYNFSLNLIEIAV